MKKIIQMALSRLILLSTLTLIGFTSFAQFNYVPGTTYTFRTLISSTQTVQMDIVYDGNDNATVTLTNVAPQATDKYSNHIFLPENNEYTLNSNNGILDVNSNFSNFKIIDIVHETSTEYSVEFVSVPSCSDGCNIGSGACKLQFSWIANCMMTCCVGDISIEPSCSECNKPNIKIVQIGKSFDNPILIIRVSGTLTIN